MTMDQDQAKIGKLGDIARLESNYERKPKAPKPITQPLFLVIIFTHQFISFSFLLPQNFSNPTKPSYFVK